MPVDRHSIGRNKVELFLANSLTTAPSVDAARAGCFEIPVGMGPAQERLVEGFAPFHPCVSKAWGMGPCVNVAGLNDVQCWGR